jgi:hypothetical protein
MDTTVRDRLPGTLASPRRTVSAPSATGPLPSRRATLQLHRTQVIPPPGERPP